MGGHNDTNRPCSLCEGRGRVNVLHLQKKCLNCGNQYHKTNLDNTIYTYSSYTSKCHFCESICVIESMETVIIKCPLCIGTGTRTWIDKMIRPYNKKRMEENIYRTVVESSDGFREKCDTDMIVKFNEEQL